MSSPAPIDAASAFVTDLISVQSFAAPNRAWIQIILIVGIVAAGVMLTRTSAGARHQAIRRVLFAVFAAVAVYFVLFPNVATRVARLVGVGRGADLLLYALVVAFFGFMATTFRRFAAMERRTTELARQLAIARAPQVPTLPPTDGDVPDVSLGDSGAPENPGQL